MRQEAAALGRKLAAAQADASEAAAAAQAAALASEASLAERDAAIYQYFEASVSRALHSSGHKSDHVMGLTRELCALKLVESQLNMQLEAARLHADALAYGSASLRRSLGSAEARISELEQDASLAAGDASGTRAQPSSAPADFTTEKRLLDCEQALAAKDLELREALARAKTSQTEAAHAREELIAAVERLREELALEHAAQMQAMEAEHLASIGRQADAVKVEHEATRRDTPLPMHLQGFSIILLVRGTGEMHKLVRHVTH